MHPQQDINKITGEILDACIKIHTELGPGLFESVYENVLMYELVNRGLSVQRQKPIRLIYDGVEFGHGFRADLLVEDKVIIELKSVEHLAPVHFKQLATHLKLANLRDGILVNFNVNLLKDGFFRRFNNLAT